ncbi:hypothetical protein [Hansschlegelia sp. KR7-227]|uniref:hypothetical protein n=1 Tax=Hansschlegelia sp. KR7-227 TaxID=3400914 RepID=UPI003BFFDA25
MADEPRIAVITANQRSGTTAIGRLLGAQPNVRYAGEIFHNVRGPHDDPDYKRFLTVPEANFFTFKQRFVERFPGLVHPTAVNQHAIWKAYCEHLGSLGPATLWVIDVKYNSWHHLDPVWRNPLIRPGLMELLSRQKAPILHILREDVFAQAVSAERANNLGRWHRQTGEGAGASAGPTRLDPAKLRRLMQLSTQLTRHYEGLLSYYGTTRTIHYESAFKDQDLTAAARASVADLFGLPAPLQGPLDLVKGGGDLRGAISNTDEILAFFSGDQHEALVARHLRR